ncbi:serine/threonine-protein kinase [Inquilinus sp. NPDC058860]|uniref:serine/threonine-protein kinase n=1 Tax=Inquilinus sp. NPDC058860 TaxID=3346652 RepID=UPI0036BA37F2
MNADRLQPESPDPTLIMPRKLHTGVLPSGSTVLHTYRIVRLINRGGMGEIYQAEHIDQLTQHAIKIILPDLVSDEAIVALFLREAEALRKIRHDAIVGYDGLFRDANGRLHLVMEYVEGPSLRDRLDAGPLAPDEVRLLRDRVASGLAVAHERGIFHRDLSPDNIILERGRLDAAKLIDFGIAKLADPGAQTLVGHGFAGKFSWASPEQVGLFGAQIDARSDIYSLGLVLAAAARGRPLDMGQTMLTMTEARRRVPVLDGVPPALAPEIARMLAPDPLDRPQSMRALLGAPAPPDDAAGVPASPPVLAGHRRWITAATAVVVLGAAGGAVWMSRTEPPPSPEPPTTPGGQPAAPASPAPNPPPSPAPPGATAGMGTVPPPSPTKPSPADPGTLRQIATLPVAEMFEAGRRLLDVGNADAALVVWEEASRRGSGPAALGIARFYDPAGFGTGPNPFNTPNADKAREFYRLALARGMDEARQRLDALDVPGSGR